jgi:hypothetical protein
MPSPPIQRSRGASAVSTGTTPRPSLTAKRCTPNMPTTGCPSGNFGLREASTTPAAYARIGLPSGIGGV